MDQQGLYKETARVMAEEPSQPFIAGLSGEMTEGPTRHSEELNNSADLVLQEGSV